MAVDVLRNCYTVDMRLHRDSDKRTRVRWYFCDEGALRLPFYTVFGSRNYTDRPSGHLSHLGEVQGTRRYYDGKNIGKFRGKCWVGSPRQFAEGIV